MTRDEILKLEAGRELNERVAIEVMGWHEAEDGFWRISPNDTWEENIYGIGYTHDGHDYDIHNFEPSTDISAAWEVVEKMKSISQGTTEIRIYPSMDYGVHILELGENWIIAETAPLAICRAALLMVFEKDIAK